MQTPKDALRQAIANNASNYPQAVEISEEAACDILELVYAAEALYGSSSESVDRYYDFVRAVEKVTGKTVRKMPMKITLTGNMS